MTAERYMLHVDKLAANAYSKNIDSCYSVSRILSSCDFPNEKQWQCQIVREIILGNYHIKVVYVIFQHLVPLFTLHI